MPLCLLAHMELYGFLVREGQSSKKVVLGFLVKKSQHALQPAIKLQCLKCFYKLVFIISNKNVLKKISLYICNLKNGPKWLYLLFNPTKEVKAV